MKLAWTGTIDIGRDVDIAELSQQLLGVLHSVDARKLTVIDNKIAFHGGIFRSVNNWNALVPFNFGVLLIDAAGHQLRYEVSFAQLVFVVLGMVLLQCLLFQLMGFDGWSWTALPEILFLVGANLLIGIIRFRDLLQTTVDRARRRIVR